MTDSMEELVLYNHRKNRQIASIFKIADSPMWQVNIRHKGGNGAYDYGHGETPLIALKNGTDRADGKLGNENRSVTAYTPGGGKVPEAAPVEDKLKNASLEDMLG